MKVIKLAVSLYPGSVILIQVSVQLLRSQKARARIILVLRECIWKAPPVSLVLPAFNGTGSLFPPW